LQPFVREVLDMERERASERGLKLVNDIPVDDVIQADRNVLSIVLHNLVANAVTHTQHGHVRVSGQAADGGYRITVADTGQGMPEAALRHARRIQGKGAIGAMNDEGERDVQGLGLLIVADLLQLTGGNFHVESTKGQGTAVSIYLPAPSEKMIATEATSPTLNPSIQSV